MVVAIALITMVVLFLMNGQSPDTTNANLAAQQQPAGTAYAKGESRVAHECVVDDRCKSAARFSPWAAAGLKTDARRTGLITTPPGG